MGLRVLDSMLAPPSPLMPEQASLFRSGVPLDSPPEGRLLWDLAFLTPGCARTYLFYFILLYLAMPSKYVIFSAVLPDLGFMLFVCLHFKAVFSLCMRTVHVRSCCLWEYVPDASINCRNCSACVSRCLLPANSAANRKKENLS